jgi:hypothetical protein
MTILLVTKEITNEISHLLGINVGLSKPYNLITN